MSFQKQYYETKSSYKQLRESKINDDDDCVICLDKLNTNVVVLSCKHVIHFTCWCSYLKMNIHNKVTCPSCRNEVYSDPEIKELTDILIDKKEILIETNDNSGYKLYMKPFSPELTDIYSYIYERSKLSYDFDMTSILRGKLREEYLLKNILTVEEIMVLFTVRSECALVLFRLAQDNKLDYNTIDDLCKANKILEFDFTKGESISNLNKEFYKHNIRKKNYFNLF